MDWWSSSLSLVLWPLSSLSSSTNFRLCANSLVLNRSPFPASSLNSNGFLLTFKSRNDIVFCLRNLNMTVIIAEIKIVAKIAALKQMDGHPKRRRLNYIKKPHIKKNAQEILFRLSFAGLSRANSAEMFEAHSLNKVLLTVVLDQSRNIEYIDWESLARVPKSEFVDIDYD